MGSKGLILNTLADKVAANRGRSLVWDKKVWPLARFERWPLVRGKYIENCLCISSNCGCIEGWPMVMGAVYRGTTVLYIYILAWLACKNVEHMLQTHAK